MKLLYKITFFVLAALIFSLSIFTYFVIKDEKETLSSLLAEQGLLLANTISASSVEIILVEDYPLLDSYLINISKNYESISFIKIIKDKKVVSSIKNEKNNFELDNINIFKSSIKIDSDLLGEVEVGLSTAKNQEIISKRIEQFLISIVIISIFLFIILLYIIKHYLLEYIEKLKIHTKLIGEGEYTKTLEINTKDEFEELAISINNMTKNILESHTHLKQLNKIQDEQKKQLIEANKSKDDFLANMSHELKTPLNSINVISSVMMKNKQKTLDEKQVKNLNIINNCGNDLLYLINDVLDISKLEAGEIILDYSTFNMYEVITNIKDMFKPQIKQKKLDFVFEYDEKVQLVYLDKQRLKQIVKNLLSNSLKFVDEGSIKLIIQDEDKNLSIIVKDDGIGIAENKLKHIFDRFKQVDSSTTRKYGGTGLGLAICKELATLLEGSIKVKSKVGLGTVFKLTIPKNSDKIQSNTIENYDINTVFNDNPNSKEKILLLNSDPISFMRFVIELKKDYTIEQVNSVKKLEDKISSNEFTNIIIDISKLDVVDIEKLLTKIERKIILIVDNKDQINNINIGSSIIYFEKPLDINKIISHIKSN